MADLGKFKLGDLLQDWGERSEGPFWCAILSIGRNPEGRATNCSRFFQTGSRQSFPLHVIVLITQLHQTLCDPMHCSPPGPSVHGISQARILQWVAIPFSRAPSIYIYTYICDAKISI